MKVVVNFIVTSLMTIYLFNLILTDKECSRPQMFHEVLDEQCNQTCICSNPRNATLRMLVFNHTNITVISHTMITSSQLYQDTARLFCLYQNNELEEEGFIEVYKKLGFPRQSKPNAPTNICSHRAYILANLSDVNCSITKVCLDHIDAFKVELVATDDNNNIVLQNSTMKYAWSLHLLSSLVCRLHKEDIYDYPEDERHKGHGQPSDNSET